jgi:NodT family efflux transporter outer membrane factor (OMF) lipoprotein
MNAHCSTGRARRCTGPYVPFVPFVPLVLFLSISGCASWVPSAPALSVIDVPSGWSAGSAAGAGGRGAIGVDGVGGMGGTSSRHGLVHGLAAWWQRFDDASMADLVNRAMASNTGINGAQAALRQARALRDVASAALLPTLGVSASAQTTKADGTAGGTGGGNSTGNRFQAGVDAQWVPDVFGVARSGVNAADAAASASAARLGDTQVQVAAEVALNYILLRSAQARRGIASDNLASQQETLQITDWRQQAGLVTALEVEQARAAAAQTQALLPALQTGIQQTAHALAVLVGQPPAALLAKLGNAPGAVAQAVPESRADPALDIPAETLRQRADVRAAEYQVAAALARVGQAQAQRWPSFSIGGSISLSAVSAAALTNGASVLSSLLASISLPVFDGGAARAQVRAQQAALEQAQQVYRAAVLGALKDVENALVASSNDRLRLDSLGVAAAAAGNAALLARQRYSSGLVDFQTVLETQRNQFSTQDGVVSARAELANDQVRLFTALGGGWVPASNVPGDQRSATQ